MKKLFPILYKLMFLALVCYTYFSFSSGPPAGLTGAPGDATCNNCHFGATQTGTVDISGILDVDNPIIPNKTYNVTITINLTSGVSTRAGFQFVALEGNTASSPSFGTFSNLGTNVGINTLGSRTYVQHSGTENTYIGSNVTYTFDWTAPAPSVSLVSFYAVGLIANGFGTNGDLVIFDSDQNIVLPVDLSDFRATKLNSNDVSLKWKTFSEQNSDYFEVLRSENGVDYEQLSRVPASINSSSEENYEYIDTDPVLNRTSFYRLKVVDLDGRFEYSDVVTMQNITAEQSMLNLFPNPATKDECLFIDFISDTDRPKANIRIYDINGVSYLDDPQMNVGFEKGFNKVVLDINALPYGQYFLCVSDNGTILHTKAFFVSK